MTVAWEQSKIDDTLILKKNRSANIDPRKSVRFDLF